jgi:hypothetical protein
MKIWNKNMIKVMKNFNNNIRKMIKIIIIIKMVN